MSDVNFRLATTKTEMQFDVHAAPDVKGKYKRFPIRPLRVAVHMADHEVFCVVVTGPSVRRDGTLGALHSVSFGTWDRRGGEVPGWIEGLVSSAGLEWRR